MKPIIFLAAVLTLAPAAQAQSKARQMQSTMLQESALNNEEKGHLDAAMKQLRLAIRLDRSDPEPFLQATRVRHKMGDREKAAGNLYFAVQRARRAGEYAAFAERVRTDEDYKGVLGDSGNSRVLDLFDAVDGGLMTEADAKARLRKPEPLRDALAGIAGPSAALRAPVTPIPSQLLPPGGKTVRKPLRTPAETTTICAKGCSKTRLDDLLSRAELSFGEGRYEDAAAQFELSLTLAELGDGMTEQRRGKTFERIGVSLRRMGLVRESITPLKAATRYLKGGTSAELQLAASYSKLGDERRSLKMLRRVFKKATAARASDVMVARIQADPEFSAITGSPRYEDLVARYRGR
jgi:tetratricopeptide (TPR) repeat protein